MNLSKGPTPAVEEEPIQFEINNLMFFNPEMFPELKVLTEHWKIIQEELWALRNVKVLDDKVRKHNEWIGTEHFEEITEEAKQKEDAGWMHWWASRWNIFGIFVQGSGNRIEKNCELVPKTVALLEQVPLIRVAGFSRMYPGCVIAPHAGFTGLEYGALAYHLALEIPSEPHTCGIKVGSMTHTWKEAGQTVVFDDVFSHTAWNHSKEERIVLYIDFAVPPVVRELFYKPGATEGWNLLHPFPPSEDEAADTP